MKSTLVQRAAMYERMPDSELMNLAKSDVMALSVLKQRQDIRSRAVNAAATPSTTTVADDIESQGIATLPQMSDGSVDEEGGVVGYSGGGAVGFEKGGGIKIENYEDWEEKPYKNDSLNVYGAPINTISVYADEYGLPHGTLIGAPSAAPAQPAVVDTTKFNNPPPTQTSPTMQDITRPSYGGRSSYSGSRGGLGSLDMYTKYIKDNTNDYFGGVKDELEQQKADMKGDRDRAKNLALLKAGFGIMGGGSTNPFINFGKGANEGVDSYVNQIGNIDRRSDNNLNSRTTLAKAYAAAERGDLKLAADLKTNADKLRLAEESNGMYKQSLMEDRARKRIVDEKRAWIAANAKSLMGLSEADMDARAEAAVMAKRPVLYKEAGYSISAPQQSGPVGTIGRDLKLTR